MRRDLARPLPATDSAACARPDSLLHLRRTTGTAAAALSGLLQLFAARTLCLHTRPHMPASANPEHILSHIAAAIAEAETENNANVELTRVSACRAASTDLSAQLSGSNPCCSCTAVTS